jgi:hypothetical protein
VDRHLTLENVFTSNAVTVNRSVSFLTSVNRSERNILLSVCACAASDFDSEHSSLENFT